MNSETVFVDANVLLETILKDRKFAEKAQEYISSTDVIISPLTAHLFVYFGKKDGLELDVLLAMLAKHRFTDFGTNEIAWAIKNHQSDDFEDALQVACAVLQGCRAFVTFDGNLAKKYREFIDIFVLK